ncbi:hypothetical protein O181_003935 [Austropuccinia psidii MF-1]|uniref:Reverse transcriptase Ty1/copia-type domain-containing protein n=1 Tax=Austropuccinia psidii MF-1 TaxID=1389203 RepID=A0A9Q3BFZ6_9BASI|nr:hypothetical protein [Austropuccinia psidii MF-1]
MRQEIAVKVMEFKKNLYGTKEAAIFWWQHSKKTMESLGFTWDELGRLIYSLKKKEFSIILWIHVNYEIVLSSSTTALRTFKQNMMSNLKSVDNKCKENSGSQPLILVGLSIYQSAPPNWKYYPRLPLSNEGKFFDPSNGSVGYKYGYTN